jgi:hypothetical protein
MSFQFSSFTNILQTLPFSSLISYCSAEILIFELPGVNDLDDAQEGCALFQLAKIN